MEERTERRILALLFGAGLLLSALLIARSQVGGDQLNLLARGWLLVEQGELVSSGHPTSGGGKTPGSLTALLVGLPMLLWHHHRAPVILLSLFHVLAYAVLHCALKDVLSSSQRVLLALFYWLNPLRLLLSGFLWNPNGAGSRLRSATDIGWRPMFYGVFWESCRSRRWLPTH